MRIQLGRVLRHSAMGIGLVTLAASVASAQTALFYGKAFQDTNFYGVRGSVPASAPLAANITAPASPTANGGPWGFTIPSKVFTRSGTSSATFPGYPYFRATNNRYLAQGGPFAASALPSTVTVTPVDDFYPRISGDPAGGFMRMKPGPNGFGGPQPIFRADDYTGTKMGAPTGYSRFFTAYGPGHDWPNIAGGAARQYGQGGDPTGIFAVGGSTMLTVSGALGVTARGRVNSLDGTGIAFTGTATIFGPAGPATIYKAITGMDNRGGGTTGFIQMVQARLAYAYTMASGSGQAPEDGTATFSVLHNDLPRLMGVHLTFVPEPGQAALLGAGLVALGLLGFRKNR